MGLSNDYFLLYHGKHIERTNTYGTNENKNSDDFFEISALILCVNRKNYEQFNSLQSFDDLVKKITNKDVNTLEDIYQLQHCILKSLITNTTSKDFQIIHKSFNYLKNENIIDKQAAKILTSLFNIDELTKNKEPEKTNQNNEKIPFKDAKSILENTIEELKKYFKTQDFISELEHAKETLSNQKFSIGITGVMNAGKSTMLNALMGKEILGSAVVPETANLTIVKHGEPEANVFYWNKQEWEKIEKSAKEIKSIADFVKETKSIFKDELQNIIKEESLRQNVDINDLAKFTSAEASGKKCNLVKYVELKSDLDFLKDGIEIVDTPGLDDPVIQREEITKEYLSQCDLMLHLMNVSQSATLKDVEFIIDALLYQNITKLLIVITRADTVSKEQLQEVINYTKVSIEKQLKAQNKDSKLDYILNSIKFIPISGKMALLHRTGQKQKAIDAGYTIEDTGILDIEKYLDETLFGASSNKSELIIKSAKSQIKKTIEKEIKSFNYDLILLSKSKEELEKDLEEFNKKKDSNKKTFDKLKEDINIYKNDAKLYIQSLETFLNTELIELQNIIRQRVYNDVKYSFEKTKKRPAASRTKTIIETAIKDGIIDIIRDYRYKFIKKSQSIGEICEQKYQDLGFVIGHKNDNFDARGFFQDDFKSGFLTSSNDLLISKIVNEVTKAKISKLNILNTNLEVFIKEEFDSIEKNIIQKASSISEILIENFFLQIEEPLKVFKHKLQKDEKSLQERIANFEEDEIKKDDLTIEIHKKIKRLDSINKGLKL